MIKLDVGRTGILDTCGMGGDGSCTFNISTATAFVAAGAGVPVVKHGNRSVSSRSGSADVLTELGIEPAKEPQHVRQCLDEAGCAFCFAPHFHPALKRFADLRRRLGVRTFFNLLGPLANPVGAEFQLLGVARPELLDPMAEALARLGTSHAILACGADGLDEVTLSGPTFVRLVSRDRVASAVWRPEDFGMPMCSTEALRVGTAAESAARIRAILNGTGGPATEVVVANAAAALRAARRADDLYEGVALAREAITGGRAARVLEQVVQCSRAWKGS
jgi:anthranilate phosphoribosyltransferase